MSTRTVRLDDECEKALAEIQRGTRLPVSSVLKQGVILVRDRMRAQVSAHPFAVYESIALGEGGYAHAPARRAKTALPLLLRRRRRP
jgi:hypothetical protein